MGGYPPDGLIHLQTHGSLDRLGRGRIAQSKPVKIPGQENSSGTCMVNPQPVLLPFRVSLALPLAGV